MAIRSSSFTPIYNTNPETNNLQVEIIGGSFINLGSSSTTNSSTSGGSTTNSANSSITTVISNNVSTILLTANANRSTVLIVNNSLSNMYILLNSSIVSSTNYTVLLKGKPSDSDNPSSISFEGSDYTGEVKGIWSFVEGSAQITEATGITINSIVSIGTDILNYRNTSLTNVASQIKALPGQIIGWNFINLNTIPVYVKLYDALAASVVIGTTTVVRTLAVPSGGAFFLEAQSMSQDDFLTAISIACVTGIADNNSGAPLTPIHVGVKYK